MLGMREAALGAILAYGGFPARASPLIIDSFDDASSAAAQAAWLAQNGSPPVEMADSGEWGGERVMKLSCNFTSQPSRCYWDRAISLDLSAYRSFALEVYVSDPDAIASFTLYFRSGAGWYSRTFPITQAGWQTLCFAIGDFSQESAPMGWNQITAIRLSPWKEASRDLFLAVRELRAFVPDVFIVRDTAASDQQTVSDVVLRHTQWLSRYNVSYGVISNGLAQSNYLADSRMVILPYNMILTDSMYEELERFVGAGGKLMAHYLMSARIESLLGFRVTGWTQEEFAAYTFSDATIQELPPRVVQNSWNIRIVEPGSQYNARVIARWEDCPGRPTGRVPGWPATVDYTCRTFFSGTTRRPRRTCCWR